MTFEGDMTDFMARWLAEQSGDPRTNDELIRELHALPQGSDEASDAYTILQARRDPGIIRTAQEMCRSDDPLDRYVGAGILSQNGTGGHFILQEECVETLLGLVLHDCDTDVLRMACTALDDYKDARISQSLASLSGHQDAGVRYAVVMGLLGREDDTAVQTLITLSSDSDEDVRNWATFGLARQIDMDTPEIRAALLRRVDDEDSEVRAEALLGLAYRGDDRVVHPLIRELRAIADADNYWDLVFEAVAEIGDGVLYPELMELKEYGIEDYWLDAAIAACRIPKPEEAGREWDGSETSCPVCGLRDAFADPHHDFCDRCGWHQDMDQVADPNLAGGWNRKSLSEERERWHKRLEASK
jgi:hypothetical protein